MSEIQNLSINIEDFDNPPVKALKMYEAVHELLAEGVDAASIKVSDITKRAGIGKGTAYEYFSTKEEIIAKALYYELYNNFKMVLAIIYGEGSFEEKYFNILDYMWNNNMKSNAFKTLVSVMHGTSNPENAFSGFGVGACMATNGGEAMADSACVIENALNYFVGQAVSEGLITEENDTFRKNAFCSQLLMYIFFLQDKSQEFDKDKVQQFIYDGMIKMLND